MQWMVGSLLPAGDSRALVIPLGALSLQLLHEAEGFQDVLGDGGTHRKGGGLGSVAKLVGDEDEFEL